MNKRERKRERKKERKREREKERKREREKERKREEEKESVGRPLVGNCDMCSKLQQQQQQRAFQFLE